MEAALETPGTEINQVPLNERRAARIAELVEQALRERSQQDGSLIADRLCPNDSRFFIEQVNNEGAVETEPNTDPSTRTVQSIQLTLDDGEMIQVDIYPLS